MDEKQYQELKDIRSQLRSILKEIEVEDDSHAPIKSAISYLSFVEN